MLLRHASVDHAEVFECPLPIQLSQLRDKDQSFLSRSVYVRFKDEVHVSDANILCFSCVI